MSLKVITKLAAATLAVTGLTGAHYHGDRVSILVPDGWTTKAPTKEGLVVFNEPGTTVNCNVQTVDLAALSKLSLEEINKETAHVYTTNEWADLLGQKPADITVASSDIQPFADAWFHLGTFHLKANQTTDVTVRYGFYVLPGRVSMTGCYVTSADFPKYKSLFDATVKSFRPW